MICRQCGFDPCACGAEDYPPITPYEEISNRYSEDLADAVYMAMHLYDRPKRRWSKKKFVAAAMFSLSTRELEKIMDRVKETRSDGHGD